jgi:hypothetical protein
MMHLLFLIGLLVAGGLFTASLLTEEIYVFFTAGVLVLGGVLAAAITAVRKKSERVLRELENAWSEKLRKLESALAEKTSAADSRDLAAMVDGVALVCRRIENRVSELEEHAPALPAAKKDL